MKHFRLILGITGAIAIVAFAVIQLRAADRPAEALHKFEYATIRWSGLENMHVIRPSGEVEFVGPQLAKVNRPNRVDSRSFYMNMIMNALAKEGYEFVGISNDDAVMKRPLSR